MKKTIEKKTELLSKTLAFAAQKHTRQRRKDADASPYINHPIQLLYVLTNEGQVFDINVLCAAVLHDTIEDTHTTYEELVGYFGCKIADIVLEVTDNKQLPKAERKQLQVEHAPHLSSEARLVKLADKISNLRDIAESPPPSWTKQRIAAYYDWAKLVVDGMRGVHPALEAVFDQLMADHQKLRAH